MQQLNSYLNKILPGTITSIKPDSNSALYSFFKLLMISLTFSSLSIWILELQNIIMSSLFRL